MDKYIPPFEISNEMLKIVSDIMEKIGKLDSFTNLDKTPYLRKQTKINSVHSSVAIENNPLSLEQVKDVINGKLVIGEQKDIQEVKNAYKAYEMLKDINPYSIDDLKKVHGVMTFLVEEVSGEFRTSSEGVFDDNGNCIFVCPPGDRVNLLMNDLFKWLNENKDTIHPLILSSIFHYEFVFIHPFKDGNGRTARLWQNVILLNWEPLFEYVPIESEIKKYQEEYYKVIQKCNTKGDSTEFIEFMLKMIDEVLDGIIIGVNKQINHISTYVRKILEVMEPGVNYTTSELMKLLNLKSRISFRENYLIPAIENGFVKMTLPNTPTSKNQAYYKD